MGEKEKIKYTSPKNELVLVDNKQPSPAEMMQSAISQGMDLEKLEKFMELQEKWEAGQFTVVKFNPYFFKITNWVLRYLPKSVRQYRKNWNHVRFFGM